MMYFKLGSHDGSDFELSADSGSTMHRIQLLKDGKILGSLNDFEMRQMIQYLVSNGTLDLNELKMRVMDR